jgi:hypothetical protein
MTAKPPLVKYEQLTVDRSRLLYSLCCRNITDTFTSSKPIESKTEYKNWRLKKILYPEDGLQEYKCIHKGAETSCIMNYLDTEVT